MKDAEGFEGVWRTIRGARVFIRKGETLDSALKRHKENYFNENFILKDEDFSKDYVSYRDFFGYKTNINKKYWNEKEKALEFDEGRYQKQIIVQDKKTKEIVGHLWYADLYKPEKFFPKDRIQVDKIEVHPDYRRKGIATEMYKELQRRAGKEDIFFGNLTPSGKRLLKKIATITRKQEIKVKGRDYSNYWGKIN